MLEFATLPGKVRCDSSKVPTMQSLGKIAVRVYQSIEFSYLLRSSGLNTSMHSRWPVRWVATPTKLDSL